MDDVVIIGGGIIGAASAYFLSKEGRKVKVIERDPTYKKASFPLSLGGFRRQFFQKENILLGKFAREFIFQIPELLKTKKNPKPTASVVPNGYLFLFGPEHAPEQYEALKNHKQCEAGTKNIKGSELKKKFPYVNDEGIETVTYTDDKKEGWIDPMSLLNGLKRKARQLGVTYLAGEVTGLRQNNSSIQGVKLRDGGEIKSRWVVNAAGPRAAEIAAMADIELPIDPQRLVTYVFDCQSPVAHAPLTADISDVVVRPEGTGFLALMSPKANENPWTFDFDIDYALFEESVWPILAHRFPVFESIKLRTAWAGHLAYNHFDRNAIIGVYPGVDGFLLANGFSGHGLQHSPATGRALMELIVYGDYQTLDLSRLSVDRVLNNEPIEELLVPGATTP